MWDYLFFNSIRDLWMDKYYLSILDMQRKQLPNYWEDRGFWQSGQSLTSGLYNLEACIFSFLAQYMTDSFFCLARIMKDCLSCHCFPSLCVPSLDNILSAIEARAFSCPGSRLLYIKANFIRRYFDAHHLFYVEWGRIQE